MELVYINENIKSVATGSKTFDATNLLSTSYASNHLFAQTDIGVMMVRNVIGCPSTDVGTLCSAGEAYINKWSKYKPVHHNFISNRPTDWWRGLMNNCGIDFLRHSTIPNLIDSINSGVNQHPYQGPLGGVNSPYRLGDFAGYKTDAIPPLTAGNVEGTYYKSNNTFGVSCLVRKETEEELSITDIFGNQFNELYYAAALQKSDSSILWMTTTGKIVADGVGYISIPMTYLTAGTTYYLYQFLSSYQKPSITTAESSGHFIAIPGKQKQEIKIENSDLNITLLNLIRSDAGVITGTINIKNAGGSRTYVNVYVYYRYGNSNPADPLKVGERSEQLDDIYIATNETKTIQLKSGINMLPEFEQLGGKVLLYMNGKLQAQGHILRKAPII